MQKIIDILRKYHLDPAGVFLLAVGLLLFGGWSVMHLTVAVPPVPPSGPRVELAENSPDGPGIAYTIYGEKDQLIYRWRFLPNGPRVEVDRRDGQGFISLLAAIRAVPERTLPSQQCAFVPYEFQPLGEDLLFAYRATTSPDGRVTVVRTRRVTTGQTLTETWRLPLLAEFSPTQVPQGIYVMDGVGAVKTDGCVENLWRLRLSYEGIADIVEDAEGVTDVEGNPARVKLYNEVTINLGTSETPPHTFREYADGKKAEILYAPEGTAGTRLVDQTLR